MNSSFCKLIIRIAGKWFCLIFYSLIISYFISTGPNVDLLCVWQSDAAPFRENYAKLYFDVKHLEKGLNRGWWNFRWSLFKKNSALFGQYWTMSWFSRLGPNLLFCGCKEKKNETSFKSSIYRTKSSHFCNNNSCLQIKKTRSTIDQRSSVFLIKRVRVQYQVSSVWLSSGF